MRRLFDFRFVLFRLLDVDVFAFRFFVFRLGDDRFLNGIARVVFDFLSFAFFAAVC